MCFTFSSRSLEEIILLLRQDMADVTDTQTVVIYRRRLLQSAIRCITTGDFSFYKPVRVTFSGEEADDLGGPTREFFR